MDGSTLRRERERAGLTVGELADALGVRSELVLKWEEGQRRISRRHAAEIPLLAMRLERERERRARPKRAQPRTSRAVLLVPLLLVLAAGIGFLPGSGWWLVVLYPVSLAAGGLLATNVYVGLSPLRGAGALGRWLARWLAGTMGAVAFIGTHFISGYGSLLLDGVPMRFTDVVLLGLAAGVGCAAFWPLAR